MSIFLLPAVQHTKLMAALQPVFHPKDDTLPMEDTLVLNPTLKRYLGLIKEQINTRQTVWDKYKRYTNPYEYIHTMVPNTKQSVCSLKPLSRSFYKMIEMGYSMSILQRLPATSCKTFHLAEGPGGFIEGIIHMRKNPADQHYGMTLLDDSSSTGGTVPGWRKSRNFLASNPNVTIESGSDGTGDLTKPHNLRHCFEKYGSSMDLITADGGFDFSLHYSEQERVSANLIFCQIAFALAMQKPGGDFIIKFFDTFSEISLHLLYLLSNFYDNVSFVKPVTSRYANSEKYVVCQTFRPPVHVQLEEFTKKMYQIMSTLADSNLLLRKLFNIDLPYLYVNRIEDYNSVLGQQQIENIDMTLGFIDTTNNKFDKLDHMKKIHTQKCVAWCQKYGMPHNKQILTTNMFHTGVGVDTVGGGLARFGNKLVRTATANAMAMANANATAMANANATAPMVTN